MVFVATAASLILWVITNVGPCEEKKLELVGLTVTPHVRADIMQYRKETEPAEGARVQLFFKNISQENDVLTWDSRLRVLFNGLSPDVLLTERTWAWHDLPSATPEESFTLPKDSLVVWSFNGRRLPFGVGGEIQLDVGATEEPWFSNRLILSQPALWISSTTFFAREDVLYPDLIAVHIANNGDDDVFTVGARLWLPTDPNTPRILSRSREVRSSHVSVAIRLNFFDSRVCSSAGLSACVPNKSAAHSTPSSLPQSDAPKARVIAVYRSPRGESFKGRPSRREFRGATSCMLLA